MRAIIDTLLPGSTVPREEIHVEGRQVDVRLVRTAPIGGEPVVLVPGLGASPIVFELHEQRSLAATLHDHGRTPWLVDFHVHWRKRGQDAAALLHALEMALAELRRQTGYGLDHVDAIGHSLGGIMLLALAADGVPLRRLVTLASGLDYRLGRSPLPRALSLSPRGIGPLRIGARRGGLPTRQLASLAAPVMGRGLSLPIQRDQFHPGSTPGPIIRRMMRQGVRDMPLALLLDLADLFTEGGLRLGRDERPLKQAVADLPQPVLMIAARQDTQCPLASVRDAAARVPGARLLVVGGEGTTGGPVAGGYGHVDLLTATLAPAEVFAPIVAFLDEGRATARESA